MSENAKTVEDALEVLRSAMMAVYDIATTPDNSAEQVNNLAEVVGMYEVLIARLILKDTKEEKLDSTQKTLVLLMSHLQQNVLNSLEHPDEATAAVLGSNDWLKQKLH